MARAESDRRIRPSEGTRDEVITQLRALGVAPGGVLLVHTSYRAIRPIEGGPRGLIEALRAAIGPEGTLVMPSWTGSDEEPFDRTKTAAAPDLGIVADSFWHQPGVMRSDHPFAFAAIGPRAEEIVSAPMTFPPHSPESPIGRVHDLDGQVLLLGVGHDASTTLHLAELVARVPYRVSKHITVLKDGKPTRVGYEENDHCCAHFVLADAWLREAGVQREGRIGNAHARLAKARDIVAVTVEKVLRDPLVFLHPADEDCEECNEARKSVAS